MENEIDRVVTRTALHLGLMSGIMAIALRGLDEMFGETEKIPKGVVKELMEGALSGMFDYFEGKMNELDYEVRQLQSEVRELKGERTQLEDMCEDLRQELVKAQSKEEKNKKKNKGK